MPSRMSLVRYWPRKIKIVLLILVTMIISNLDGSNRIINTHSISGNAGLIMIPSGYVPNEKNLSLGVHYIPKRYAFVRGPQHGEKAIFFDVSFFPFLEITGKITRPDNIDTNPLGIGERSINFRIRLLEERRYYPSVTVGAHDVLTATNNRFSSAPYIVASKELNSIVKLPIYVHLGYGANWDKLGIHTKWTSKSYPYLCGFFYGMNYTIKNINFMLEYDTNRINFGMSLLFCKKVRLYLSTLGFQAGSFGISYSFILGENIFTSH